MANKLATMLTSRGAMFGLDARITLFVFALLSTVTGFVLYQRAEEAQDIKLYADIQEMELALKIMQRDLGVLPGYAHTDGIGTSSDDMFLMFCNSAFVASGFQKRWKGPYLNKTNCSTNSGTYKTLSIGYYVAYASASGVDSSTPPGNAPNACTVTGDCYAWIGVDATEEAFAYINRIVDELNGATTEVSPEDNGRVILYNTSQIWYRTEVHQ